MPFLNSTKVPLSIFSVARAIYRSKYKPLDGELDFTQVSQDEVDHLLILGLSDVLDERSRFELVTELPSRQTVLGKAVIPVIGDLTVSVDLAHTRRERDKESTHSSRR